MNIKSISINLERESNILPITREIDSDSDNEIDKDFRRTLGIKDDRVLVPGERGRTTQVSWGMKELMLDPKAKVSSKKLTVLEACI